MPDPFYSMKKNAPLMTNPPSASSFVPRKTISKSSMPSAASRMPLESPPTNSNRNCQENSEESCPHRSNSPTLCARNTKIDPNPKPKNCLPIQPPRPTRYALPVTSSRRSRKAQRRMHHAGAAKRVGGPPQRLRHNPPSCKSCPPV